MIPFASTNHRQIKELSGYEINYLQPEDLNVWLNNSTITTFTPSK